MAINFPHLSGDIAGYPGAGRELYKQIPGAFDQSEWTEGTKITLLSVPWGVYEPNVNDFVPGFETEEERDEWFRSHTEMSASRANQNTEAHVLDTPVRYQMDTYVDLPFTFDYASKYNYLIVEYGNAPVTSGDSGLRKWYYHIIEIDFSSPSCTRVKLAPDYWTTCLPFIEISHMILERGHAPVAATSVDDYLNNPIENCSMLLAPDVDYGDGSRNRVAHNADNIFNDENAVPVIVVSGLDLHQGVSSAPNNNPLSFAYQSVDGVPNDVAWAVTSGDLFEFITTWAESAPQTLVDLKGIYFVNKNLLDLEFTGFSVFGCTIHRLVGGASLTIKNELTAAQFGYDEKYAKLAKLYTSPYAHLEIAASDGSVTEINIEDLYGNGTSLEVAFNAIFPYIKIDAHVSNYGGARRTVYFGDVSRAIGGKWQDTLVELDIPTYGIYVDQNTLAQFEGYYQREQSKKNAQIDYENAILRAQTAYDTGYASANTEYETATASASTTKTNADANNSTSQENNNESAQTGYENTHDSAETAETNANASATTAETNSNASASTVQTNTNNSATTSRDNTLRSNTTTKTNADASADASYANALRSAQTSYDNTIRSADATLANTERTADTGVTNVSASNAATMENLDRSNATSVTTQGNNYDTQNLNIVEAQKTYYENAENDYLFGEINTRIAQSKGQWENVAQKRLATEMVNLEAALGLNLIGNEADAMSAQASASLSQQQQINDINAAAGVGRTITNGTADFFTNALNPAVGAEGIVSGLLNSGAGLVNTGIDYMAANATANVNYNTQLMMNTIQNNLNHANLYYRIANSEQVNDNQWAYNAEKYMDQYNFSVGLNDYIPGSGGTETLNGRYYRALWAEEWDSAFENMPDVVDIAHRQYNDLVNVNVAGYFHNSQGFRRAWDDLHQYFTSRLDYNTLANNRSNAETNLALTNETLKANAQNAVNVSNANQSRTASTTKTNAQNTRDISGTNASASQTTANTNATNTRDTAKANNARTKTADDTNAGATYTLETTNAKNTYDTTVANAERTKDTATENAHRTYTTSEANALRTRQTSVNNAARTYNTTHDNNARSYNTATSNATKKRTTTLNNLSKKLSTDKEIAENNLNKDLANITASFNDSQTGAHKLLGDISNAQSAITRPVSITVNVVTEDRSAIAQAGTEFLRHGYALNQALVPTTLNVMQHFSYWKCSDAWVTGIDAVPEAGQDAIRRMLYNGVTVWRDPDDIGKVSIYEN